MDNEAIVKAGMLIGDIRSIADGGKFVVIPADAQVRDIAEYLPAPPYPKVSVAAKTVDTLIAYVNRHKTETTSIFADIDGGAMTSVIDYHSAENDAHHAAHRVRFTAQLADEWKTWMSIDGKEQSQDAFARFIEENRVDVVTPDGATVLEIAKTLEAKKKVNFKSGLRLEDGSVDLAYSEDVSASGGLSGKLSIPTEIVLGIPVFYGGDRYRMTAFFRYRIDEGRLKLKVDLHRAKHIRDAAFDAILKKVGEGCPGIPLYEASI